MRSRDKLAAARLLACERMPYFRTAVLGLVPKELPGLGRFGVTKNGVLMWDADCLDRWTVEETGAVLIHEISHLLRGHADRCERMGAEHDLWNIAGDLEINDDLLAAKLPLPGEGVFPKALGLPENQLAEEYYHQLSQMPKMQVDSACGAGDGQQGDDGDDQDGAGQGKDDKDGESGGGKGIGRGRCGGCAGNPEPGEGDHEGGSGRSQVEMERIKRQVAEDIHKEAARGRSTVPGGWKRWADQQLKPPQIPWRQKLSRAVRAAIAYRPGAVDYHYNKPSRRQAGVGFGPGKPIMPALRAPIPRVAVIVDTSGSMAQEELAEAVSECSGILKATGSEATFCACDAKVHTLQKVRHWKDVTKLLEGGGGTDFRPPIEAMAEQRPRPDVVVFITDGMGPAPATPPPFKMVWVLVGPHRCKPSADSYGGDNITYGEFIEIFREDQQDAA